MPAHTHDGIDWVARLADLRQADESNAAALRAVADRLIESLPAPHPTVIDVGCGAGGMSAALAAALVGRAARATTGTSDLVATPGSQPPAAIPHATASDSGVAAASGSADGARARGTLVLVDAVPELLAAAGEVAAAAVSGSGAVTVRSAPADIADAASFAGLPAADLVWAANVAHHLPDQRAAISTLTSLLAPGGVLALSEGGLSMRCLPWDVGVGEPGLQDRLIAAHGAWFHQMRTGMTGVVRMPVGWNRVLAEAGLGGVTAFSYLVDVPAPLSDAGRGAVVSWLTWMTHATADLLDPADLAALRRLLDPADIAYVARRDDVFMLKANTVYLGWR
ncbi:MAG TPA: class I SAM-dependent methyltransferase [Pseudonocardiaceae bacterium]|jgi:SAM-dependent methyltransferase|nr:class I SAM-dependent methyltransferase [Pseudonocardiaceae bacterium]